MTWIGDGLAGVRDVLSLAAFEAERAPACVLSTDGVILAVNSAWDAFCTANGGPDRITSRGILGTRWLDHITGEVPRTLARQALETARDASAAPARSGVTYRLECNAPGLLRLIGACFMPLRNLETDVVEAIAVVYATEDERAVGESTAAASSDPAAFVHEDGTIRQCSGCRRFLDPADGSYRYARGLSEAAPVPVSHGLCQVCVDLWWGAGSYRLAHS